jgi:hypothetical protein
LSALDRRDNAAPGRTSFHVRFASKATKLLRGSRGFNPKLKRAAGRLDPDAFDPKANIFRCSGLSRNLVLNCGGSNATP